MGWFKEHRLEEDKKVLFELETRYNIALDNMIANDTASNRRNEKLLFQAVQAQRKKVEHFINKADGDL